MVGKIFAFLVIAAVIFGGISGKMDEVCEGALSGVNEAVDLSVSLAGVMCLWSGIIRVLDKAGFTRLLAKVFSPILRIIYLKAYKMGIATDEIAADYSANFLGLGNAALPIGIKAINRLKDEGLYRNDTANDDMVMFAVLNTTPLQLIPTTLIALRLAHNSQNAYGIILPVWICSVATTIFGVIICKAFAKFFK